MPSSSMKLLSATSTEGWLNVWEASRLPVVAAMVSMLASLAVPAARLASVMSSLTRPRMV
ncbi:hypothetical protein D3C72_2456150 [compost metagenome]